MQQLTQIIQNELTQKIKDVIIDGGKLLGSAVNVSVQGLYSPLFINSSVRQFNNRMDEMNWGNDNPISEPACIVTDAAQLISMSFVHVQLGYYAIVQGMGLEYFGALGATNAIDSLWNLYKKYKK